MVFFLKSRWVHQRADLTVGCVQPRNRRRVFSSSPVRKEDDCLPRSLTQIYLHHDLSKMTPPAALFIEKAAVLSKASGQADTLTAANSSTLTRRSEGNHEQTSECLMPTFIYLFHVFAYNCLHQKCSFIYFQIVEPCLMFIRTSGSELLVVCFSELTHFRFNFALLFPATLSETAFPKCRVSWQDFGRETEQKCIKQMYCHVCNCQKDNIQPKSFPLL